MILKEIFRKAIFSVFISAMLLVQFLSACPQQDGDEIVLGTFRIIPSKILNEERTLLIHLPEDYAHNSTSYPVLFLLYGDHVTTYFGETVSILDRLGQTGRIPEMLLVAVTNTDRYRDLLPANPDGTAYRD